ncbi:beta-propeller domain-containing protein [bacterium]|nr:beta-propeller domain-containing protein [bacterium]
MKKFIRFFTVLAVFLFIFTACGGKGNPGKQEISDNDPENQVSDGEEISDDEPEPDGTEKFVTISSSDYFEEDCPVDDTEVYDNFALKDDIPDVPREIFEGDVYKLDGNTLLILHPYKGLVTVDISDPDNLEVLDSINLAGQYGHHIYLQDERAYVLVSRTDGDSNDGGIIYYGREYSKLVAIDTKDPKNLSIAAEFVIDGYARNSKQIGDIIYVVAADKAYSWTECDGTWGESRNERSSIVAINIKDPENIKMADKISAEVAADLVYFSDKHIYVAESKTDEWDDPIGENRFSIFDISDPDGRIIQKSTIYPEGFIKGMYETDNFFYLISTNYYNAILESFDVSDPANIIKLDTIDGFYNAAFNGHTMYGSRSSYSGDQRHYFLAAVDLTPDNLSQVSELEIFGSISDFKFIGTKMLTIEQEQKDYQERLVLYDLEDPGNPREISGVLFDTDMYVSYCRIFNEIGLLLCPGSDKYPKEIISKVYLADLDLEKGLKIRGAIAMDDFARFGTAVKNRVFAASNYKVVSADITDRDKPKILSEQPIAVKIPGLTGCGEHLCGINERKLFIYDGAASSTLWQSNLLKSSEYTANLVKNDSSFYLYNNHQKYCGNSDSFFADNPVSVKTIKNDGNGSFGETESFNIPESIGYDAAAAVSDKNIMAFRSTKWEKYYDGERERRKTKHELHFVDMNEPAEKITASKVDFNYRKLFIENRIFVSGDTFWTSGCIKNTAEEEANQYLCYAVPFTVDKSAKPKAGKRINIPGELMGISKDGQYLYTKTPAMKSEKDCEDIGNCRIKIETSDFYILKINNEKNSAEVVKKETLEDWKVINYNSDKYPKQYSVSNDVFIKDDQLFFVSRSYYRSTECVPKSDIVYEIKILSAADGKEIFADSFEQVSSFNDVQDGGLLLLTNGEWIYVATDGKTKKVELSKDLGTSEQYSPNSAQLIGDTVYIGTLWGGIYSFDVK